MEEVKELLCQKALKLKDRLISEDLNMIASISFVQGGKWCAVRFITELANLKPKLATIGKGYLRETAETEKFIQKTYTTLENLTGSDRPVKNFKELKPLEMVWQMEESLKQ